MIFVSPTYLILSAAACVSRFLALLLHLSTDILWRIVLDARVACPHCFG